MGKYVLKRLGMALITFFGITVLVFSLSYLAPGTPLEMVMSTPNATEETVARVEARLGLDQPAYIQYFRWLGQVLHGNFGVSYRTGNPVWKDVSERIGPTLFLTLTSLFISVLIAVPLGIMSAYKPYSAWDYMSSGLSFVGAAMPNFFAALLLIYFLSVKLRWLPSGGMYGTDGSRSIGSLLYHMILPVIVLCIQQIGGIIRQTRGSMMEVLEEDYVRTARAKGCLETRTLLVHAFRNGMVPVVTSIGMMIPFLAGGAVVTEQIFAWPGLGSLMVMSISARDYPEIMGITVFIALCVLVGNLIIDLLYGLLDPRIRYQ